MKEVFQKIGMLVMALLVLFSTVSFTVNKHFCGDYLVDQSIFSEARSCGMEHFPGMSEDNGCKDQSVAVEGQDELSQSSQDIDKSQQVFMACLAYSYNELFQEAAPRTVPFTAYSPPTLVRDIQLLDQVFLI